jgi:two-component system, response regulator YesN
VTGRAPNYFSLLFKQHEHGTFDAFVRRLRIDRAKELLAGTDLCARRVAQLSGFSTANYFGRAFRRAVAMTPLESRRKTKSV